MNASGPIRVGFVLHGLQVAGAEMLVLQMIERLRERIRPTIFCLDRASDVSERVRIQDVEIVRLDRRPGWDFRVSWRLVGQVRRRGIEVLHAHQYSPFFYSALAKISYRPLRGLMRSGPNLRLIFTEHGRHYPDLVPFRRRFVNRLVLNRAADAVNAVSSFSADSLASQDGFSRDRIEVIENGIDVDRFISTSETPADLNSARRYVVHIARFHPVKDHVTLLKAFQQVAEIFNDVDLLLVGDGPSRNDMEEFVRELHLQNRVRFLGIRQDIPAILRASKVFVLTSLSEGAPLTMLEAMAAGLPVVVTAAGGMPEIVREGVDGLLTPRGDDQAIAAALSRLLGDPKMASTMGSAGTQRVRDSYSIDRTVKRYYDLYSRLAGRA